MKQSMVRLALAGSVVVGLQFATSWQVAFAQPAPSKTSADLERGRYLTRVTGCNDCHTAGYNESAGKLDEKQWLTGSPMGWNGPWGTTYASNLRLLAQKMTEAQFLAHARKEWRPPMPWFNARDMSDADLGAIYRYVRSLGAAGNPAPAALPPGQEPPRPYITLVLPAK